MKKKTSMPERRLPIDFGNEHLDPVPVARAGRGTPCPPSKSHLPEKNGFKFGSPGSSEPKKGPGTIRVHPCSSVVKSHSKFKTQNSRFRSGFTLVEILVVLALLSLIVYALMAVFASTQRAFRASLTQTDTLEGGRAVMDLMANDLETMTPSDDPSNNYCPLNFFVSTNLFPSPPSPLYQSLIGSPDNVERTNLLENIFILSKANINGVPSWIGTGYSVNTNLADGTLYPLYRFYMYTNAASGFAGRSNLFNAYAGFQYNNSTNWSHLMDGVVDLTVRCYDTNGVWMTNGYPNPLNVPVHNVIFRWTPFNETFCVFYSNAVPASVQVTLGTLEDRVLAHAEGLSGPAQSNYLSGASGQVHLFTRRVWIRNLDLSAYQ